MTLRLADTADTFVKKGMPAANFGSTKYLRVHGPNEKKMAFVRFDVSGLNGDVVSAVVKLYLNKVVSSGILEVRSIQANWSESNVTFNNRPQYSATPTATLPLNTADAGSFVTLDVTGLVRQWAANPGSAYGIALVSESLNGQFHAREAANAPVVEVTVQ
jgi:hypothetical protein